MIQQSNRIGITSLDANVKKETNHEKKQTNKIILVYNTAREILVNSTSHGIPNIIRSESVFIKLVWLGFLLAATGLSSFLVAQSIFNYYNYDVNTKTRIVYDKQVPFPQITICNKQQFTTNYSLEFLTQIVNENDLNDIFDEGIRDSMNFSCLKNNIDLIQIIAKKKIRSKNSSNYFKSELRNLMADSLIECRFNAATNFCDHTDFVWIFNSFNGNCYVYNSAFNGSNITVSTYAGKTNGLSITMFLGTLKNLKFLNPSHGLLIKIDNGTLETLDNFIEILPGYETNIAIQREIRKQLAEPYSSCILDNDNPSTYSSKLFDLLLQSKIEYKQSNCFDLCYQTMLKDSCNCTDREILSIYDISNCESELDYNCLDKIFNNFLNADYIDAVCKPFCPLECNKTMHSFLISSNKLSMDFYSKIIDEFAVNNGIISENETLSLEDKMNSIIKFNIYYDSLSYTITTETPAMDIVGLLSNIGGTLGLFLGVSVLTVVELIDILLQAILIYIKN